MSRQGGLRTRPYPDRTIRYSLFAIRRLFPFAIRHSPFLATRHLSPFAIRDSPLAVFFRSPLAIFHHSLFAIRRLLPFATRHSLLATRYSPSFSIRYSQFAIRRFFHSPSFPRSAKRRWGRPGNFRSVGILPSRHSA
jgi:hypothetical protein